MCMIGFGRTYLVIALLACVLAGLGQPLEELVEAAWRNNPAVAGKEAELSAAKMRQYSAFTNFLPNTNGTFRYTYLGEVPYLAFPEELGSMMPDGADKIEMGKHDNYDLTLTVQQPLFTGGAAMNGYRLSLIDTDINDIALQRQKAETALETVKGYYGLKRLLAGLISANAAHNSITEHTENLRNMYEAGLVRRDELLKAEIALSEMELAILRITDGIQMARENIETITGIPAVELSIDTSLAFSPTMYRPDIAESLALSRGFDARSLELSVEVSERMVGMSLSSLVPNVALAGNWHYKNPDQELRDDWYDSWDISLVASMNIFSFGSDIAEYREARFKRTAAEKRQESAEDMIRQGVKALIRQIMQEVQVIEIAEKEILQADEHLEVTRDLYEAGKATTADLLDAETALLKARNNRIDAICNVEINEAELYMLTGDTEKIYE